MRTFAIAPFKTTKQIHDKKKPKKTKKTTKTPKKDNHLTEKSSNNVLYFYI